MAFSIKDEERGAAGHLKNCREWVKNTSGNPCNI